MKPNPDALHGLGYICEKRSDLVRAADYYRKAIAANPNHRHLADMTEFLARVADKPSDSG